MTFGDYRRVIGFLVHLRPFLAGIDRTLLYGMYDPFEVDHRGHPPEAGTIIKLSRRVREQAERWCGILHVISGMFISGLPKPKPLVASRLTSHLFSDAALLGSGKPGIGGFIHGFYWALELDDRAMHLPISMLEFTAITVGVIVFEPLVRGEENVICTDSMNCVQVLESGSAHLALMQHVHVVPRAARDVEYSINAADSVRHTCGPANPLADAASRAKWVEFFALCAQLGMVPQRLVVPERAIAILESTLEAAAALSSLESFSVGPPVDETAGVEQNGTARHDARAKKVRRRGPMAGVRVGEAKHPGPGARAQRGSHAPHAPCGARRGGHGAR